MSSFRKIIRLPDVQGMTGMARSSLYRAMTAGEFPRSISLGLRSVGWIESDVQAWVDTKIQMSRLESTSASVQKVSRPMKHD